MLSKERVLTSLNWQEPDPTLSAIAGWCGGCHTLFHGLSDGTDSHIDTFSTTFFIWTP